MFLLFMSYKRGQPSPNTGGYVMTSHKSVKEELKLLITVVVVSVPVISAVVALSYYLSMYQVVGS